MTDEHITMDGEECDMIERYEAVFGENSNWLQTNGGSA